MDITEDLSARVLVKHILNVEPPRTPLTRSAAAARLSGSGPRRSNRLNKPEPTAQTPQLMLRRSLKHKIRESISSKAFPSKRRTASIVKHTSGQASVLFDDADTPRQILKNILLTEPVKSPVVNEQVELPQPQTSPDSSLQSIHPSIEGSGLDLPDLTIGNIETTVKRLNRKRPHRSLNVTAFEKRLKDTSDVEDQIEKSVDDPSSLSLSGSTSLTLKTPFTDVRTERKALQRKGISRRKVSEEDFGAAVDKREMGNYHGITSLAPGQVLSETTYNEGFTLGLSKLSEPDISTDIVNCNTALYAKTDAVISNYSTLATQDKPTVMASQIQSDMMDPLNVNQEPYSFPMEKNSLIENQNTSQSFPHDLDVQEGPNKTITDSPQSEQKNTNHTFDINNLNESRKLENVELLDLEKDDSQTKDDARTETSEKNYEANKKTGDEDDDDAESSKGESGVEQQNRLEDPSSLRPEEGTDSQNNEEEEGENEVEDKEEEEGEDVEEEEGMEKEEQEEELEDNDDNHQEEGDEEEQVNTDMELFENDDEEGPEEEVDNAAREVEDNEAEEEEDVERDMQEDEKEENLDSEHVTQRAQFLEGELIIPIQSAKSDLPDNTEHEHSNKESTSPIHKEDAEEEADDHSDKENATQDHDPPDDEQMMEQSVEESDDEEEDGEEIPLKTPAFVKEKRLFSNLEQASPFAPKTSRSSDAHQGVKPKQKIQRKPRSQKSDPSLPKSYVMNVFKHFAKTKVSADVYPVLKDVMDKFFDRLAKDLEAYALHARRSTIEVADCELLLRRQGIVNDKVPVEVLIEKYLRMDQRKLLIPIATSGNVVFPKRK